ncbi:heterokaryon incompatibility protein-domain-containing protein [Xylariales sp. AK1849]|nr:heterokaryon incompatibility protein-domain-containing protein [Xylariales sp. AK1849]
MFAGVALGAKLVAEGINEVQRRTRPAPQVSNTETVTRENTPSKEPNVKPKPKNLEDIYNNQRLGHNQIRIAEISPGELCDPLKCTFKVIDVHRGEFEALSYRWGKPMDWPLEINGVETKVAWNLFQALPHLRRKAVARKIWFDALCIDQNTLSEKRQQLDMMGKIYSCATRTII